MTSTCSLKDPLSNSSHLSKTRHQYPRNETVSAKLSLCLACTTITRAERMTRIRRCWPHGHLVKLVVSHRALKTTSSISMAIWNSKAFRASSKRTDSQHSLMEEPRFKRRRSLRKQVISQLVRHLKVKLVHISYIQATSNRLSLIRNAISNPPTSWKSLKCLRFTTSHVIRTPLRTDRPSEARSLPRGNRTPSSAWWAMRSP